MKILVAIANYGTKNQVYIEKLISEYRLMPFEVDIVVLSNIPKDFGPDIEVVVGLPSKNPWSLPFGHKKIFADSVNDYDLFIYSEDDTLIKEQNIKAFLKVSKILPDNEIAGFVRYEVDQNGRRFYTTFHSHYHWDSASVKTKGKYTFAHFTNEHSACFLLTREQLKRAIHSGGFLVGPREGKYDMLCTAATDPYTQCGFKKMICISHIDKFSLHHLPNAYLGKVGIESSVLTMQINALLAVKNGVKTCYELLNTKTNRNTSSYDKPYYEICRYDIINLIPRRTKHILSLGCGCSTTEAQLVGRGYKVVGIPLDSVIAASAAAKGVKLVSPNFGKARQELAKEQFDCLLFLDVLQHIPKPVEIMSKFIELLTTTGLVITSVPNFDHVSVWRRKFSTNPVYREFRRIRNFEKTGIHYTTKRIVKQWFSHCGMKVTQISMEPSERYQRLPRLLSNLMKEILAPRIVVVGRKP